MGMSEDWLLSIKLVKIPIFRQIQFGFPFAVRLESSFHASLVPGHFPASPLAQPLHRRSHTQCLAFAGFGNVRGHAVVVPG